MKREITALALAGGVIGLGIAAMPSSAEARVCIERHFDRRGTCAKGGPGWPGGFGPGMRPIRPGWAGAPPWALRCRWVAVPRYIPGFGPVVERRRMCG